MSVDRNPDFVELSREEILKIYPFFGDESLCVDSIRIEKQATGDIGARAIGKWVVPERAGRDHFKDFKSEAGEEVKGLAVGPGHWLSESLAHTLGLLATVRYPDLLKNVLPTFKDLSITFTEGAFIGEEVNLCVQLINIINAGRGRVTFDGKGAVVLNGKTLASALDIQVRTLPLAVGVRAFRASRSRHQGMTRIEATFDKFDEYFTQV